MKKPELDHKESETYMKIVKSGTMDDMFDLGYAIGRARLAQEQLDTLTNKDDEIGDEETESDRIGDGVI